MPLKCMLLKKLRKIPDRSETKSKRKAEWSCLHSYGKSPIAPEIISSSYVPEQEGWWANLPEELLHDIIKRIEASQCSWPGRRDVVACASVCRSWRETTKEVVTPLEQCGLFTFPDSLKQPGPRDSPVQCYIKRERGMFYLYLGLSPVLSGNASKLLLAARRIRRATKTDYLISLTAEGISRDKNTCIGKLRSNFLGTKFTVYDIQHPCDHASPSSDQIKEADYSNQQVLPGCLNIANISYELNVLRNRGPRKMQCIMHSIPTSSIDQAAAPSNATPPPNATPLEDLLDQQCPPMPVSKAKGPSKFGSGVVAKSPPSFYNIRDPLVLKNKAPRWHEQLQCWCLNFKGRVTVASVKNFQLVAAASEPPETQSAPAAAEQEKVVLQFGKIGKDIFTMDYAYPLSAFQAFAICLSSFDTKPTGD